MRIAHRTVIIIIIVAAAAVVTRLPYSERRERGCTRVYDYDGGGPICIVAVAVAAEPGRVAVVRADPNKSFREILIIA